MIMGNLPPGADDSFNLSPVDILAAKLNPEIGAPEMPKEVSTSQGYCTTPHYVDVVMSFK